MSALAESPRYSIQQTAQIVHVHVGTIWRWVLHGVRGRKLPTVMIGGRRYVLARDLEAFLAAGNEAQSPVSLSNFDDERRVAEANAKLDRLGI